MIPFSWFAIEHLEELADGFLVSFSVWTYTYTILIDWVMGLCCVFDSTREAKIVEEPFFTCDA